MLSWRMARARECPREKSLQWSLQDMRVGIVDRVLAKALNSQNDF